MARASRSDSTSHRSMASSQEECIKQCLVCYETCLQQAMNHCLENGGKHVAPEHFRLMINCSEICRTTADFMISNSSMHAPVCAACAEVCDACAESCDELKMDECAEACRRCAESCRETAGDVHILAVEAEVTGVSPQRPM
jgi:hypothetical protein